MNDNSASFVCDDRQMQFDVDSNDDAAAGVDDDDDDDDDDDEGVTMEGTLYTMQSDDDASFVVAALVRLICLHTHL